MESGVMSTNDDATLSKYCSVNLKYWEDDFIKYFFYNRSSNSFKRKTPEINRGYYARYKAFEYLFDQFFNFIDKVNKKNLNNKKFKLLQCQIINIGCGFDTLYWRLKVNKRIDSIKNFVDLDLDGVTCKKVHLIRSKKELLEVLGDDIKFDQFNLHSKNYHLVAGDLKNIQQINEKLFLDCKLDASLPTFIVSECVLVYVPKNNVNIFLNWVSSKFEHCILANYEQVNLFDKFGQIMMDNFKLRNCQIMDLDSCRSLETQKQKYLNNGFVNVVCHTMETVYKTYIDQSDRKRIEKIEFLDETILLDQLLNHYCISVCFKGLNYLLDDKNKYKFGFY